MDAHLVGLIGVQHHTKATVGLKMKCSKIKGPIFNIFLIVVAWFDMSFLDRDSNREFLVGIWLLITATKKIPRIEKKKKIYKYKKKIL